MGDYKLKIKGKAYDQVEGTKDWTKNISRDFNDRIFRSKADMTFTAWGSLYNLIYSNMQVNGACNSLEGRVYFRPDKSTDYAEWWRGEMKPQDFEFDLINAATNGQILDDVWAAKLDNSQDQKVFLRSTVSKNGASINQCDFNPCHFFDQTDPVLANYIAATRICFRIYDVFTFLVNYHTDGLASFASDFFTIGGNGDQYYITTGQEIREGTGWVNPEVSFSEVFEEMNKKCNLWIIIETDDFDNPVLRIEPQEYVFNNLKAIDVENPESINLKIDLDQLYTIIEVGSDALEFTDGGIYPDVRFLAWNDESYNTAGDCEFENNTLDLVSTWKIDTNTIHKVFATGTGGDSAFDTNIFLVEIDPTTPFAYNAFKFTTDFTSSATAEYIYNFNLTNAEVIEKWFNGIPQAILKDIDSGVYAYVLDPTGGPAGPGPRGVGESDMRFNDDTTPPAIDREDIYTTPAEGGGPSGVYTGMFQPEVAGWYIFNISITVLTNSGSGSLFLRVKTYSDEDRGTEIGAWEVDYVPVVGVLSGSIPVYMPAGSAAWVRILKIGNGSYTISNSGFCEVSSVEFNYAEATDSPMIYIHDIGQFKMTLADFNTLDNNRGYVRFKDNKSGRGWNLWAKEMTYDPLTGIAQGEFIGTPPLNVICSVIEGGIWNDDCFWDDMIHWVD